jgi:hypothetical protein
MSEHAVLAGIAKQGLKIRNLYPDKGDGRSGWLVTLASQRVADIRFAGKRLSSVGEDAGPYDQQAGVPFAEALWGALRDFQDEGRTVCAIRTGALANAGPKGAGEEREIWLSCGARTVNIGIESLDTEDVKGTNATLQVILGSVYE